MIPDSLLDQVITGDARQLARLIPDRSCDLVFCDPVYDRIEDYAWLAATASRVLKDDTACLVWASTVDQYKVQPVMASMLRFVMPLTYTKIAKTYKAFHYKTFIWSTPLLWFQKGNFANDWLIDTVIDTMQGNAIVSSQAPPSDTFRWHKNPEAYRRWLTVFCPPGGVVLDPFCGSGSLEVECKILGRHFVAFEHTPETAQLARDRVLSTQAMAPVFLEEQQPMPLEVPHGL